MYNQDFQNHLTQLDNITAISMSKNTNPFEAMSNVTDCNELHLMAHGSPGNLDLGSGIDTQALYDNAEYLSILNVQKIILWGCNVGKDTEFIKTFSNLTNSAVYASKDYLGKNKGISDEFPEMNDFIKSLPFYLTFDQLQKLIASDAEARDKFGNSVSISGNYAIVGAYQDDSEKGSAYIFDVTTGAELQKLTASNADEGDRFGYSVSISGNYAIVGAYQDDSEKGSAYIFDVTTGAEQQKLTASDAAAGDKFGISVSISGDYAIVGAYKDDSSKGSAYIFDVTTGAELQKLTASNADEGDRFGWSVSISGNYAIVGAHGDDSDKGSAYIFDVTTGAELQKLIASDAAADDKFGYSVSISGNYAIVGAYQDDSNKGSAYIFDVTTGAEQQKLTASDAAAGDKFGRSVSISGNYAIVGAYKDDTEIADSGSAYIFDVTTGAELQKLIASDARSSDRFGYSVSISGDYAIVGAHQDDSDEGSAYIYDHGSAYIFDLPEPITTPSTGAVTDDAPADICFPAGTPITTDQGAIAIEKLIPGTHTIKEKPILGISQTKSSDNHLLCFEKHALGHNIPDQQTTM